MHGDGGGRENHIVTGQLFKLPVGSAEPGQQPVVPGQTYFSLKFSSGVHA